MGDGSTPYSSLPYFLSMNDLARYINAVNSNKNIYFGSENEKDQVSLGVFNSKCKDDLGTRFRRGIALHIADTGTRGIYDFNFDTATDEGHGWLIRTNSSNTEKVSECYMDKTLLQSGSYSSSSAWVKANAITEINITFGTTFKKLQE